jgi:hypothetical protein
MQPVRITSAGSAHENRKRQRFMPTHTDQLAIDRNFPGPACLEPPPPVWALEGGFAWREQARPVELEDVGDGVLFDQAIARRIAVVFAGQSERANDDGERSGGGAPASSPHLAKW